MKGFVYAIHAVGTNRVKVGYSAEPEKRLADLQTASPFPLALIGVREGTIDLERAIHERLHACRQIGEWFEIDPAQCWAIVLDEPIPAPFITSPNRSRNEFNPFRLFSVGRIAEELRRNAESPAEVLRLAEELATLDSKISDALTTIDQMFAEANVDFDWSINDGEDELKMAAQ